MALVASALCGVIGLARRRGTHTKARRHEETEARIGLGSGFHYFIFIGAAFTPYGKQ